MLSWHVFAPGTCSLVCLPVAGHLAHLFSRPVRPQPSRRTLHRSHAAEEDAAHVTQKTSANAGVVAYTGIIANSLREAWSNEFGFQMPHVRPSADNEAKTTR